MTKKKTDWIQTFTGRKVHPLELEPGDVCIEDIAHALSLKCRFTGHCREFYSVADHSLRVAATLSTRPRMTQLRGLLHDAAEAYLPDVARPIKRELYFSHYASHYADVCGDAKYRPSFGEVEARVLGVIDSAFGLDLNQPSPSVVAADLMLLATEARDLMGEPPEPWAIDSPVLPERIVPLPPQEAERQFLARFAQLMGSGTK